MVTQSEILEYIKNNSQDGKAVKRSEINKIMRLRYPNDGKQNLRRKITSRMKSLVAWEEIEQVKKPKLYNEKYSRGELFYRVKS